MKAYLSIGANLGNREKNIKDAVEALCLKTGYPVAVSPVYETEPVGFSSPDMFLNQVVIIETDLSPSGLLDLLKEVETTMGRIRKEERNISRLIDLDILFYEDQVVECPELVIPHPRMHERRFVLEPFCDIAPDFIHPILQMSVKELLSRSSDNSKVKKLK